MKKNKLHLWMAGCVVLLLSSCLGGDADVDEWNLSNCQIASFSLQNDSIPGLNSVKFTIDQVNGLIFNKDSMPYGTVIDRKTVCQISYVLNPSAVEVYQEATKDSTYWNGSDSLDFSNFVRFRVYSYDGKAYKNYTASLNVHQQHPDSMTWTLYSEHLAGKTVQDQKVFAFGDSYWMYVKSADGYGLYKSSVANMENWTKTPLDGFSDKTFLLSQMTEYEDVLYVPTSDGLLYYSLDGANWTVEKNTPEIKALLGVLNTGVQLGRPSVLAAIVKDGDAWLFASMTADMQWKTGTAVPDVFPIFGFGSLSYEQMYYPHLTVVAGKDRNGQLSNASWGTMDGLAWTFLSDAEKAFFEKREGAMLTQYDNKLFMIGGIDASNNAMKDIYQSVDKGITWTLSDTLIVMPETCRARGYASVLVDKDQFMLLFGGKESNGSTMLEEWWRGRINRLGFKEK